MAEYVERKEAIDYIEKNQCRKCSDIGLCAGCAVRTGIKLFEKAPAADVVPVVRCKDCKHSYEDIDGLVCSHGICVDCIVREDFFCADGVKREAADD